VAVVAVMAAALVLPACRKLPEADPAKIKTLAENILRNVPVPGAARDCTPADLPNNATMTMRTTYMLAEAEMPKLDRLAEWINPRELDSPAALVLIDEGFSEKQRRQAAAELLAAPSYLIYSVDHIAAPLALGLRETKRGSVGARALRYDKRGELMCILVFDWLNDDNVAREGFAKIGEGGGCPPGVPCVPADVIKKQRDDLVDHYLKKVQSLMIPQPQS
jgi:hypothetical protein